MLLQRNRAEIDMQFRNTVLYDKLRTYIEGACKDSLAWRPHTTNYQNLVKSLLDEDTVLRNLKWWAPDKAAADEAASWLTHFCERYQEEAGNGLTWHSEAFDHAYWQFEEFLYQDSYVSHFVSPLESFSCDLTTLVELERGVYVRKPDNLLSNILRNQELVIEYRPSADSWIVDVVVEQPKSVQRKSGDSYTAQANRKLRTALQSLRLLHKGKVFVGPLYYLLYPEFAGFKRNIGAVFDTGLTLFPLVRSSYFAYAGYILQEEELEELVHIYGLLAEAASHHPNFLSLPLGRFHDYYGRTSEVDGLLDLMIALEALFGGGGQEVGYSLAVRCSCFLETEVEKRKTIFNRLKDIYDVRSSVVHGRSTLPKKWRKLRGEDYDVALALIVDDAEEYVRQAIRKVLIDKQLNKFENSERRQKFLNELVLGGSV